MSYTFMHIGMEVAGQVTEFFHAVQLGRIGYKFFEETAVSTAFIVGVHDVAERYRFGAVFLAQPIGVWQVDANGCTGGCIACLGNDRNGFGTDTFHFFLFMLRYEGRVVLKPLGFIGYGLDAFGAFEIFQREYGFVAALDAHSVIVYLN